LPEHDEDVASALGLRLFISPPPELTVATASILLLNAKLKIQKTPPPISIAMKVKLMPLTSFNFHIS
jgi:hypothetical protein